MSERTHELRIFANAQHKMARPGELILHLWFIGKHSMELDLDIALHRPDVAYVDLIDCINHTTKRLLRGGDDASERKRESGSKRSGRRSHG